MKLQQKMQELVIIRVPNSISWRIAKVRRDQKTIFHNLMTCLGKGHHNNLAKPPSLHQTSIFPATQVAFLMNCGMQGADANPSLAEAYPVAPISAPMEQRVSYEHYAQRAPLSYQGVQQQLPMADFDAVQRMQAGDEFLRRPWSPKMMGEGQCQHG